MISCGEVTKSCPENSKTGLEVMDHAAGNFEKNLNKMEATM
jgi:hypothetical protein